MVYCRTDSSHSRVELEFEHKKLQLFLQIKEPVSNCSHFFKTKQVEPEGVQDALVMLEVLLSGITLNCIGLV